MVLRSPNPPRHAEDWLFFAREWLELHPNDPAVRRSAQYLLKISRGELAQGALPPLPWILAREPERLAEILANLYQPITLANMLPVATCKVRVRAPPA